MPHFSMGRTNSSMILLSAFKVSNSRNSFDVIFCVEAEKAGRLLQGVNSLARACGLAAVLKPRAAGVELPPTSEPPSGVIGTKAAKDSGRLPFVHSSAWPRRRKGVCSQLPCRVQHMPRLVSTRHPRCWNLLHLAVHRHSVASHSVAFPIPRCVLTTYLCVRGAAVCPSGRLTL